jgi:hypothetical protein
MTFSDDTLETIETHVNSKEPKVTFSEEQKANFQKKVAAAVKAAENKKKRYRLAKKRGK